MFRFTIRDMLWLTLVAAVTTGWLLDRRRLDPTEHENALLRLDNSAKSQALEIAAKKEASSRREVELMGQLVRNREAELQKRDAELRDSLSRREAVLNALRASKDLPEPSADNRP